MRGAGVAPGAKVSNAYDSAMNVAITVHVWEEGRQFIAHAMPLDVAGSGLTPQAAREAADEAVRCFLHTAADAGTLEQVLEECGYVRSGSGWISPGWVGVEHRAVAV